jgi:hypothetical protein
MFGMMPGAGFELPPGACFEPDPNTAIELHQPDGANIKAPSA